ncbi:MAG: hypothetical protein KKC76_00755 [Proteobacteria bacterium]|nr:hypothetical protein [Pseudomonadota bacterium]MBU0967026.1 hypothetical protein [Pseudomonadota bacterium]MBU4260395.1 hypothetical protein [Pseudomonadota bacterium]MBU4297063.1 hypothetical protein [Pseudomonadota bacterium]MCG2749944.1 hypothetical protein [Desulfobulbaceae bacterium]
MKSFFKKMVVIGALISLTMALVACSEEGTAEKAGKEVDKTFNSVKEKVHEATK